MNTFQLTCFLTLSETLNFAKTAEQLSVTQPAVTHQIQSLEAELGVRLFTRSTRSVALTHEGLSFIGDARTILETSMRAVSRFQNGGSEIQPFSTGCQSHIQILRLPGALKKLHAAYERLHPRFQIGPLPYLFRMLDEGSLDILLSFRETDTKKHPFSYRELKKIPIVCVCAPDFPLAALPAVDLNDLRREKIILTDPVQTPAGIASAHRPLIESRSPSDFYFSASPEAAITLAEAGFGAAVLPDLFLPETDALVRLPIKKEILLSFGIYYKSRQGDKISKDFMRFLGEEF